MMIDPSVPSGNLSINFSMTSSATWICPEKVKCVMIQAFANNLLTYEIYPKVTPGKSYTFSYKHVNNEGDKELKQVIEVGTGKILFSNYIGFIGISIRWSPQDNLGPVDFDLS